MELKTKLYRIQEKIYLHGKYIKGIGRAHQFGDVYRPAFGCPMVATFNVQVVYKLGADRPITEISPTKIVDLTWPNEKPKEVRFWLCQINGYWAWAMKWDGSRLSETHIEFISKRPLPEHLKSEPLTIEIFERWPKTKIEDWASKQYQWQGFSWLSHQRVNSQSVWETIKSHADWSEAAVLDVGSHYGYHSFMASKEGAFVTAVEPNGDTRTIGQIIAQYIEMQDVQFIESIYDYEEPADITLYLSVQHQWDKYYQHLVERLAELKLMTKHILFVELILPPMFGGTYTSEDVDKMVGGEILKTYKHRNRGIRRIYKVKGVA